MTRERSPEELGVTKELADSADQFYSGYPNEGERIMYAIRHQARSVRDAANQLADMCDDDYENVTDGEIREWWDALEVEVGQLQDIILRNTRSAPFGGSD